jgi:hypothetical protein
LSVGSEGAKALGGILSRATKQSREWQREQLRRTGYATAQAELGHSIAYTLREAGYSPTVAQIGGQLGAVATAYNFIGNVRIGAIVGRHERTVQRARALLEADGLIRSELLLTGDMIDGMRSPVRHPHVVRDVSALQRLARAREHARTQQPPRRGKRRPSAADAPAPAPAPMTPDDLRALGEAHPEFAVFFGDMAQAAAKRGTPKPPPNAATIDPRQVDMWDAETQRREREMRRREQLEREREPRPPRGPPR